MLKRFMTAAPLLFLLIGFMPGALLAADSDDAPRSRFLTDRWSFRANGALVKLETDVAAGSTLGALINIEEVLGFDEEINTFDLSVRYRFTENLRHSVRLNYTTLDRKASKVVDGVVPILDLEFIGAVESEFDDRVLTLGYEYSFTNNGRTEAGFSAGVGTYDFRLAVAGEVVVTGQPDLSRFAAEQTSVVAPVPIVGIFVNHALTPDLILELRTSFMDLEIGEHNGRVFNTLAYLTWYFSRHVGAGIGLAATDISYSQKNSGKRLLVNYAESSIQLGLTVVF